MAEEPYEFIDGLMIDGYSQNSPCIYIYIYIYMHTYVMVVDRAPSRWLVLLREVKLSHQCGKQLLTLCGETEYYIWG